MTVYLVILHDHHSDDAITVHASIEGADAEIETTKAQYPERKWKRTKAINGWERHWETSEEGPWIHVEKHEVAE
jgi:hypothetical protein